MWRITRSIGVAERSRIDHTVQTIDLMDETVLEHQVWFCGKTTWPCLSRPWSILGSICDGFALRHWQYTIEQSGCDTGKTRRGIALNRDNDIPMNALLHISWSEIYLWMIGWLTMIWISAMRIVLSHRTWRLEWCNRLNHPIERFYIICIIN